MNSYVKNKWTIALIWLAIIGMLIWIAVGTMDKDSNNEILVDQETYTVEHTEEMTEGMRGTIENYFIVRADKGIVKVYWADEQGEHLHKETTIPFELLSDDDQKMLEAGVKISSEDELAGFLENYDS